ncbi:MAG: ABC transporter permease [Actinobacteria bacterium]|nr:ABC transporter permease [Actinomycetota bacterium]
MALVVPMLVLIIVVIALIVPLLPLQDPITPDYDHIAAPPQSGHLLGTDLHGRDQLSRVLWASRTSLLVGVVATGLALVGGIAFGAAAVYGGRFIDSLLMRIADIFLSFPVILGAIAIMAVLGPGRHNIFMAIAFFGWPVFARVFRSSVLSVREKGFVKAARVLGAGDWRIFTRHVLPNSMGPLASYSALAVAGAVLAEAGLSFINLGVQRPNPSWGLMLSESMGQFEQSPWIVIVPGVAITCTVLVFMLLGDVVSARFDPRRAEHFS